MPSPQQPSGLKAWGKSLWDQVTDSTTLDAAGYFILAEACRTADIIENLSGALRSGNNLWIRLADEAEQMAGGDTLKINIIVNPMLGEIRQQRLTMRQLLAQLKLGSAEVATAVVNSEIDNLMNEFNTPD